MNASQKDGAAAASAVLCKRKPFPHRGYLVAQTDREADLNQYFAAGGWIITIDGAEYQIRNEGVVRRGCTMWRGSARLMSARSPFIGLRYGTHMSLDTPIGPLGIERVGVAFFSGADLFRGQKVLARIAPPHAFSSRVNVTLHEDLPFELICFAICMAAEMRLYW